MADLTDARDAADVTSPTRRVRRSRVRRAGESAYGLLLLTRQLLVAGLVLLILAAGVRASWDAAGWAAAREGRGTMAVGNCSREACTGRFAPADGGAEQEQVRLEQVVGVEEGDRIPVVLRGDDGDVVRSGTPGLFRACLPLGGALVLAAVVLAGGLRMRRTAWVSGIAGVGVLVGAFVTM